jgi:hypothetical protein
MKKTIESGKFTIFIICFIIFIVLVSNDFFLETKETPKDVMQEAIQYNTIHGKKLEELIKK